MMIITKKQSNFVLNSKNNDNIISCPYPRIQQYKLYKIEDWYKIYYHDIEKIVQFYLDAINNFTSDDYLIYFNNHKIKNYIIKFLYNSSINKYKSFILGL